MGIAWSVRSVTNGAFHAAPTGLDHEKSGMDRVRMREKEEWVMTQLGLPGTSSYVLEDEE